MRPYLLHVLCDSFGAAEDGTGMAHRKTKQNLNVGIWPKLILLLAHINCITFELVRPGTLHTTHTACDE